MIDALVAFLIRLLCGPTVRYECSFEEERPRVFFANHSSHLDFLTIWATLPVAQRRRTRPVAAKDYWAKGFLRRFFSVTVFNALLIDRQKQGTEDDPIEQMVSVLDQDESLIIFPEGTRGSGQEIAPFRAGLYHIGEMRSDVELVPVHLENLNRILPKGESLPVPLLSFITYGRPLSKKADEPRGEFLERARQALIELEEAN